MIRLRIPALLMTLTAGLLISIAVGSMVTPNGQAGTRVATIDVVLIVNEYQRQKDLSEEMLRLQQALSAESETRTQKIDAAQAELNAFNPTDPAYKKTMQDLFAMRIDYKNWHELKQAMMTGEVAVWTHTIYKEIVDSASSIAQREGIDVVLYRDEFPPVINDVQEMRNIIRQRKMIYSNPQIDMSQAVLSALNAAYRAQPVRQMINIP
ncbi:MAG: OmpH family outer membrane protein [Planctomycetes bacterium]|nr:OmpH family outer membrane protein [Planctomycetota bacterium]